MEIPEGPFFWRVVAFANGIWRLVDGLFYHRTPDEAANEFHDIGEAYLRAKGVNKNEVIEAKVVTRQH